MSEALAGPFLGPYINSSVCVGGRSSGGRSIDSRLCWAVCPRAASVSEAGPNLSSRTSVSEAGPIRVGGTSTAIRGCVRVGGRSVSFIMHVRVGGRSSVRCARDSDVCERRLSAHRVSARSAGDYLRIGHLARRVSARLSALQSCSSACQSLTCSCGPRVKVHSWALRTRRRRGTFHG